jgi:hypothetical protein
MLLWTKQDSTRVADSGWIRSHPVQARADKDISTRRAGNLLFILAARRPPSRIS